MQIKKLIAFVLPILFAISTSGCVDIYILKDFFEKKPIEYIWKPITIYEKENTSWSEPPIEVPLPIPAPINQTVNITIGKEYTLVNYTFELKKDTKELNITIKNITETISLVLVIPGIGDWEFPIDQLKNYTSYLESFGYYPYVNITIFDDEKQVESREYKEETNDIFFKITDISDGNWKISIRTRTITIGGNITIDNIPIVAKGVWKLTYTEPTAEAYQVK